MARRTVSRNDPCPCGSGKKFKHCCLGKDIDWSDKNQPSQRRALSPEKVTELLQVGPYGTVDDRLKAIAKTTPGITIWKGRVEKLTDRTKPGERLLTYQSVRDAKVLPDDAGFFLIGMMVEWLSADPDYGDLSELNPEEVGAAAWAKAFDAMIAGLLRSFGETEMAEQYVNHHLEYDRRYERGRQFFFGPPVEEHAKELRERGVIT